jgi:hypothetical protein
LDHRITMLEGALIWDSLTCENNASRWYIGQNVYDVFNRLSPQNGDGQVPQFLQPLEAIMTGKQAEDLQEHEIGMTLLIAPVQRLDMKSINTNAFII